MQNWYEPIFDPSNAYMNCPRAEPEGRWRGGVAIEGVASLAALA